jgi:uncharacterized protein (DUF1800 family)
MFIVRRFCLSVAILAAVCGGSLAQEAEVSLTVTNGNVRLDLPPVPGTQEYKALFTPDLSLDFNVLNSGAISGFTWNGAAAGNMGFYRAQAIPMAPDDMLSALLLNRLAYGPTPDELERIKAIGPDAWIAEQLAPETIAESLDIDVVNTSREWQRVVVTGVPTARDFYIYLEAVGDVYIDDLKIVTGTNPDAAGNFFTNPGFESGLAGWNVSTNLTNSVITTDAPHTGANALHIISTTAGSTRGSAIWQTVANLPLNTTATLSYWWKPGTNIVSNLTMRFSGSGIVSSPDTLATKLAARVARSDDLRAWHVLRAVRSKKQLQEVLLQWLENHFVTQASKSRDYFDGIYDDPFNGDDDRVAANLEYREIQRWRAALNNPQVTFKDLLTISAESPAQIIYLDTVASRGDGSNIPNENYAREILELFTFGVDNGYDQTDITLLSRAWTGWTVQIVDETNEFNPLAPMSTTLRVGGTNTADRGHLAGVWAFNYRASRHWNQGATILFPGKTVPDRFGPPYAGRDYTLGVDVDPNVSTNWQRVTKTGVATSSTLYMYLAGPGDIYLDDISFVAGSTPETGANLLANGGFESGLTGWTVSPNHADSRVEAGGRTGSALHMIATEGGSTRGSSIYRTASLVTGQTYTLSFWWRPATSTGASVTLRLSGSGADTGIQASAPQRLPGSGLQEGYRVIAHLSDLPFTQEFISVKLCRLFVHDGFAEGYDFTDPNLSAEGKLVRACMDAWENNTPKGQLRKVLAVIFNSELFRSQGAAMHKVKTPLEFTVSAVRALRSVDATGVATADTDGYAIGIRSGSPIDRMGAMRLFDRAEPDGYPEVAAPWISAGTLAERTRWVQALCIAAGGSGHGDAGNSVSSPVALLKRKLPSAQWNDAGAVADYFLGILLPGEGKANLDLYRTAAINFLNTADNGTTASSFATLGNTTTTYDTRVRGMVAAIMTSQRFHEQ